MVNDEWVNISATRAVDICRLMDIDSDSRKRLHEEQTPSQFIDDLIAEQNYSLAVQFLSYALPKREAVWWGTQCIHSVQDNSEIKAQREALEAAKRWAKDPTEDNRQTCGLAAERSEYSGPSGMVAMASFFSSGSLAPPEYPVVEPPSDLTPKMVSAALSLATVHSEPEKANDKYKSFLELGLNIAQGVLKIES